MNKIIDYTESNTLIAEFMQLPKQLEMYENPITGEYINSSELNYDSCWNWIMTVVEKIESLNFRVSITEFCTNISNEKVKISQWESKNKIDKTYKAILEFIQKN